MAKRTAKPATTARKGDAMPAMPSALSAPARAAKPAAGKIGAKPAARYAVPKASAGKLAKKAKPAIHGSMAVHDSMKDFY